MNNTQTLSELRAALEQAEHREFVHSMSDDYCYTNGTIYPLNERVRSLRATIEKMEADNAHAQ
jgi:hypothetical protein